MKLPTYLMLMSGILFSNFSFAYENSTQVSRYMTATNKPKHEQMDLMAQIVQIRFPQNVQTIGEASTYLLRFSGYSLVSDTKMVPALQILLSKPLPLVDRELGPMTLRDAIITLVGCSFELMNDPINREINFKLKHHLKKHVTGAGDAKNSNI